MSPSHRSPTATRKATEEQAAPRIPAGLTLRLHATTALSMMMRGDHEGARALLSGLTRAEVEEVSGAAQRLASTARLVLADFDGGAAGG